jgi:hypothetical protein
MNETGLIEFPIAPSKNPLDGLLCNHRLFLKPMRETFSIPPKRSARGFALVITLSLLVLLVVISVGLLSLSSISLRASVASSAMAEARANARLSVQLALGQLQLLAGQDSRVTASSQIVDPSNPVATGVWRSWEGSNHDGTGKPIVPDYQSKLSSSKPSTAPGGTNSGRFLGWLNSTAVNSAAEVDDFEGLSGTEKSGHVPMIGEGSVADTTRQVYLEPLRLENGTGSLAWWTSGDNAKAMINTDAREEPASQPSWQERVRSNGVPDPSVFDLAEIGALDPETTALPSDATLRLVNPEADLRGFHDFTSSSVGLLTNVATGGWRKDLSLMSEKFNSLPSSSLPFFTVKPGKNLSASKANPSSHPPGALLYPWATYRSSPSASGWQQVPPVCSWSALVDYVLQYRNLTTSSAAKTSMPSVAASYGGGTRFNFQDQVRRAPQVARIHWIFSLGSAISSAANTPEAEKANYGKYIPGLVVTPVLTLWNPYNVEISVNTFGLNIQQPAPLKLSFKVGPNVYPAVSLGQIMKTNLDPSKFDYQPIRLRVNQEVRLAPGASRVYSIANSKPVENATAGDITLVPGYKTGGGFLFYGLNEGKNIYAASSDSFSIQTISYDGQTKEGSKAGSGIIYDIIVNGTGASAHRMIYAPEEMGATPAAGLAIMNQLYPPLTLPLGTTLSAVQGENSRPFASAIFGYRMASTMSPSGKHKHLYSKGMLQTNPLTYYTEIGFGDDGNAKTTMAGTGVYHPINAPYDFAFQEVQGWNDTLNIPQWDASSGSSFIVSGLNANDGLTRCVMAELPTRPIQSIADLVHFDARNNNPIPPFQFNLIGNANAHPIFGPTQTAVSTSYNNGMCNDDAYMLNHLLFDDWFVSSIAPDVRDFGRSEERKLTKVYEDHLSLAKRLPNARYRPAPGAAAPTPEAAQARDVAPATSYQSIASKLEVEGMFNINSVSVSAWKALLRHCNDTKVPFLTPAGATSAGSASSFSYPRTSIAGDTGSDSGSKNSGLFSGAAEFAGHRVLTEEQIDALAEEIVNEVRKRGPFLSLSEFVNRQLVGDKSRALAGTIQQALDNLAATGSSPKNPFRVLQEKSIQITAAPPGSTDYKFPEAALGWSAFGVPGWVRQADILRPLAPILSARDDTFTIRGYGDARDPADPDKVLARAWCEVRVRRVADYVDKRDEAKVAPYSSLMKQPVNRLFGRRYQVESFRWLNQEEV